ncbi:unnamed protein product [Rotaria socialis]|uniref:DNA repair endonuclease XPF n=1 Tax=Rotaria socialis TaxID=392032 RepID=A0A818EHN5_9BILA|nr:unnamed protein product [Rotaria socialis]CAF4334796.1 unnamed protein product [Rotaria socialis]
MSIEDKLMNSSGILQYENEIILQLYHEDGLLILARGLGLERIFCEMMKLYCAEHNLVFILGCTDAEQNYFTEQLISDGIDPPPRVITADISIQERKELYIQGGLFFVTARILTVDLLTNRIPIDLITGLLVYRAHRIADSSSESFIVRLYRDKNKTGFIKGFSDSSLDFTRGYNQLDCVMKNLFLRHAFLYPRFHVTVRSTFEHCSPDVIELQVPLTLLMTDIQVSLMELISACLQELRSSTTWIDHDLLTVDQSILNSFDRLIRLQLQPIWNQISIRTKQLINDIKTLRLFVLHLTQYDCVTFYNAVQAIFINEKLYGSRGKNIHSPQGSTGSWLYLPAAERLLMASKCRVFGEVAKNQIQQVKDDEEPVAKLEENPKLKLVSDVLQEIRENEDNKLLGPPVTLVVCAEDRTCSQLKQYLLLGGRIMLERLLEQTLNASTVNETSKESETKQTTEKKGKKIRTTTDTNEEISNDSANIDKKPDIEGIEGGYVIEDDDGSTSPSTTIVYPFSGNIDNHFILGKILLKYRPRFIILYDASLTFVRQLEVFKATNPEHPLRIYFLLYGKSIEEQRYLLSVKKEKEAFENLVREKASMVIPEEREGRDEYNPLLSRDATPANQQAYGAGATSTIDQSDTRRGGIMHMTTISINRPKIIVDMREFRSELPSLIWKRGIDIEPVTLEVGDYILTPEICIERKSVSDLIGSLNNGRLYQQALQMTRFYKKPMLLIEFDQKQAFHLANKQRYNSSSEFSSHDITSKLALLTMHFPKLKILWCPSPHTSAELFEDLKRDREEPDTKSAMLVTAESDLLDDDERYNTVAQDFLIRMPGVTFKNYKLIMNNVENLRVLSQLSENQLTTIMGNSKQASLLYNFIHKQKGDLVLDIKSKVTSNSTWKKRR